mmetsp:Transcript_35110/g.139329  ORF Transcript_35110/g.139329 Transcript_35110/m.139329 type:complete len:80 (+) Transcript_35110:232-471(+)
MRGGLRRFAAYRKIRGMVEIELDEFAFRQFDDPTYAGTRISYDKKAFEEKVNDYYRERVNVQQVGSSKWVQPTIDLRLY